MKIIVDQYVSGQTVGFTVRKFYDNVQTPGVYKPSRKGLWLANEQWKSAIDELCAGINYYPERATLQINEKE